MNSDGRNHRSRMAIPNAEWRGLIIYKRFLDAVLYVALTGGLLYTACPAAAQPAPPSAPPVRVALQPSTTDATELAQKLQNPIGDLVSVPFQNDINFNIGPHRGTQDILNIQPVIPFHLNDEWNVVTRTIVPLVWSPTLQPAPSVPFGLGATSFSAFLSPRAPVNGWIWGVGPIAQIPTITSKTLGSNQWGAGPALVVVRMASPWVYGALVNNVFSFGGTPGGGGTSYSVMTLNPFVNYNFGGGWFVGTSPVVTASWETPGAKWTVPIGAQFGRLIKIMGKLPVNMLLGAYYNVERPRYGATWQLRTQVALVF
jgi:hypothetical protein